MPTCLGCGYVLAGLVGSAGTTAGVCPECGRGFDWADPKSLGPRRSSALDFASFAPPWPLNVGVGVGVLLALVAVGSPTGHLADGAGALSGLFWLVAAGLWLLSFLMHGCGRLTLLGRGVRQPRWRWSWVAVPVVLAGAVYCQREHLIWRVRWWQARGEFASLRERVRAGEVVQTPRWVGTFRVVEIEDWTNNSRLRHWSEPAPKTVYWLGWPDSVYSGWRPALIDAPESLDVDGWPITHPVGGGWFACMDNT